MRNFLFPLFLLFFLYGFSQETESQNKSKIILDSLSNNHIRLLCKGDINYLNDYSLNYVNLRGGSYSKQGKVFLEEKKRKFKKFVSSDDFLEIKGKTVGELFDISNKRILNYDETLKRVGKTDKLSRLLKKGDYAVILPRLEEEDSFFDEGWYAVYRLEKGGWKIITAY